MADIELTGSLDLDEIVDEIEDEAKGVVRDTAAILFTYQTDRLFGAVPIDSGRFRHSWNVSVNEKDEEHPDVNEEGPFPAPEFDLGEFELGDTIIINNSIPYAIPLNEKGHVQQVQDRFFEANFEAALGLIDTKASVLSEFSSIQDAQQPK